jgi:transposase InsO family protein
LKSAHQSALGAVAVAIRVPVRRAGRRRRRCTRPVRSSTACTVLIAGHRTGAHCGRSFSRIFGAPQPTLLLPLTITDFASRYLLGCEALDTTREASAFPVFERVFEEFGLPDAMRTDNGVPCSSPWALYGLSKLSVWWLRLGIRLERITPAIPSKTAGTNACISR